MIFNRLGVLAIGEYHGMKENYTFYEEFLNQLPVKPNLAIEIKDFEKIELEKFLAGKEVDSSKLYKDGRVNVEFFNFLKKYQSENRHIKIISIDEIKNNKLISSGVNISRDEEMAINFLNIYEKPIVIISGNAHTEKQPFDMFGKYIVPMGYFIKNKIGDFPLIKVLPLSGYVMNFEVKKIELDIIRPVNEFIEKEPNSYYFYLENVTPVTFFNINL